MKKNLSTYYHEDAEITADDLRDDFDYPLAPARTKPPPGLFDDNQGGGRIMPATERKIKKKVKKDGVFHIEYEDDPDVVPQMTSRMQGFWDPDDDIDQTYHFLTTGGAKGPLDWEYQQEEAMKDQVTKRVLREADKEWKNWPKQKWEDPCVVQQFEFQTCLKVFRHTVECAMTRDAYSRCRNEFAIQASSEYEDPKQLTALDLVKTSGLGHAQVVRFVKEEVAKKGKKGGKNGKSGGKDIDNDSPASGRDYVLGMSNKLRDADEMGGAGNYIQILDEEARKTFADSDEWFGTDYKNDSWLVKKEETKKRMSTYWPDLGKNDDKNKKNIKSDGKGKYLDKNGKPNFHKNDPDHNHLNDTDSDSYQPLAKNHFRPSPQKSFTTGPDFGTYRPSKLPKEELLQKKPSSLSTPPPKPFKPPASSTEAKKNGLIRSKNERFRETTGVGKVHVPRQLVVTHDNWDDVVERTRPKEVRHRPGSPLNSKPRRISVNIGKPGMGGGGGDDDDDDDDDGGGGEAVPDDDHGDVEEYGDDDYESYDDSDDEEK